MRSIEYSIINSSDPDKKYPLQVLASQDNSDIIEECCYDYYYDNMGEEEEVEWPLDLAIYDELESTEFIRVKVELNFRPVFMTISVGRSE